MAKSLFDNQKRCYICLDRRNIHKHHVYGGPHRDKSEKYGEWVYLCAKHHNMSDVGVHFNIKLNQILKELGQIKFEDCVVTREDFVRIFWKSYIEE